MTMNERDQHSGKWKRKSWLSRAEGNGFYLLRWLLTSKPTGPSEPRKGSAGEGKDWVWEQASSGGESDKDLYKKKPPPHLIWSSRVTTPASPLQEMGDLAFGETVGRKLSKKYKGFLNPKIMSFQTDKSPWVPSIMNDIQNLMIFQNLRENVNY